jgi:redox-sensitive bicupin YhaK (pirin superfamily)
MSAAIPLERLPAHVGVIGPGLTVRRALPARARRTIGAWCFLDHAGPVRPGGMPLRVGPHPHIGLQTFTWMIEGEMLHRDSLGYRQVIRPGQVNLMTAGRGIAHSEESVDVSKGLHLAQLWIALPEGEHEREPGFAHFPELPIAERGGFRMTILVGEAFGNRSPVPAFTPLLGVDLASDGPAELELPVDPSFEHGVLVLEGDCTVDGEPLPADTLAYAAPGRASLALGSSGAARVLFVGGAPFGEPIVLWWNFVARTQDEIVRATHDWNERRRFGEVEGFDGPRLVAPDVTTLKLRT